MNDTTTDRRTFPITPSMEFVVMLLIGIALAGFGVAAMVTGSGAVPWVGALVVMWGVVSFGSAFVIRARTAIVGVGDRVGHKRATRDAEDWTVDRPHPGDALHERAPAAQAAGLRERCALDRAVRPAPQPGTLTARGAGDPRRAARPEEGGLPPAAHPDRRDVARRSGRDVSPPCSLRHRRP